MSNIWKLKIFKKIPNSDLVECLICKEAGKSENEYQYKCKTGQTTPLIRHLVVHPEKKEEYDNLEKKRNEGQLRKCLTSQATSVSSEQLFSVANDLFDYR